MTHNNITVRLPEPEAYILHKLLISRKRRDAAKQEKDLMAAKSIGELCLEYQPRRKRLKTIYAGLPGKWQRDISGILESLSPDLYSFLTAANSLI